MNHKEFNTKVLDLLQEAEKTISRSDIIGVLSGTLVYRVTQDGMPEDAFIGMCRILHQTSLRMMAEKDPKAS